MNRTRTTSAVIGSAFFLGLFAASASTATAEDSAPCATQQARVDRANAKLADLTAKFAAHPTTKNQKAKKAQAQRVAHAMARLDKCAAAPASSDAED
jgi:hypothetical protein